IYPLNSCADGRLMLLAALPGAALQYAFGRDGEVEAAVLVGSIALEALGAALAGSLVRRSRAERPTW
ncbi:MAG: hypothetical protein HY561_03740, partial [Gemmatimonadetes bacterium]|nr:hypothetical protein [Gemmatimonadota bacterium]